jgi:hypothetical protein
MMGFSLERMNKMTGGNRTKVRMKVKIGRREKSHGNRD